MSPFVERTSKTPSLQLEVADVERPATEVVDGDLLFLLLVEPVRQGRCGRLVDDALDVEPRDAAGILRRLALGVVEVGRDGDDRLGDLLAEVGLGVTLQLLEDHRADLGRAEVLVVRRARRRCRRTSGPSRPGTGRGPCCAGPRDRRSGAP